MQFWRICRRLYASAANTGEGSRRYGGRWNSRGVAVVYASTSLALAAVETFVNLEPNLMPHDVVSIKGDIPDSGEIDTLDLKTLPARWSEQRDDALSRFGGAWVRSSKTVALLVPSAAIRGEWNILLNPAHPAFPSIRFESPEPFDFDVRMFR